MLAESTERSDLFACLTRSEFERKGLLLCHSVDACVTTSTPQANVRHAPHRMAPLAK